jgi:hypothetical protein
VETSKQISGDGGQTPDSATGFRLSMTLSVSAARILVKQNDFRPQNRRMHDRGRQKNSFSSMTLALNQS